MGRGRCGCGCRWGGVRGRCGYGWGGVNLSLNVFNFLDVLVQILPNNRFLL